MDGGTDIVAVKPTVGTVLWPGKRGGYDGGGDGGSDGGNCSCSIIGHENLIEAADLSAQRLYFCATPLFLRE